MAVSHDANVIARLAGADLRTHQGKFVKLDASHNVILVSATTDRALGILENNPNTGERADIRIRGIGKAIASATIANGAEVGATATGLAVSNTTTATRMVGICTRGGAINEMVEIDLVPAFIG